MAENKIVTIKLPEIKFERQHFWQVLEAKYRKKEVIKDSRINFTEKLFYMAHADNRSSLLHSLVVHLSEKKAFYAKRYSFEFWLIKAAVLEGFFGLRECLAGLVNCVFQLGVDCSKIGSSSRVMDEALNRKLAVTSSLQQIIPKNSMLGSYLDEFRHPYVHREDLSKFSVEDMTASIIGAEQPRIIKFIDKSVQTSKSMQAVEKSIADECTKYLRLT